MAKRKVSVSKEVSKKMAVKPKASVEVSKQVPDAKELPGQDAEAKSTEYTEVETSVSEYSATEDDVESLVDQVSTPRGSLVGQSLIPQRPSILDSKKTTSVKSEKKKIINKKPKENKESRESTPRGSLIGTSPVESLVEKESTPMDSASSTPRASITDSESARAFKPTAKTKQHTNIKLSSHTDSKVSHKAFYV